MQFLASLLALISLPALSAAVQQLPPKSGRLIFSDSLSYNDPAMSPRAVHGLYSAWEHRGLAARNATDGGVDMLRGQPDGYGAIWQRNPFESSEFELEIVFTVEGSATGEGSAGLGLWFLDQPPSAPAKSTPPLLGYDAEFEGFAVFFASTDRAGNTNPSVSAATGTMGQTWNPIKDVPTSDGIYFNFRSTAGNVVVPTVFKLVVTQDHGIRGLVRLQTATEWKNVFTLKNGEFSGRKYLGITTANTGTPTEISKSDSFRILRISMSAAPSVPRWTQEDRSLLQNLSSGLSPGDASVLTRLLSVHIQQSETQEDRLVALVRGLLEDQRQLVEQYSELKLRVNALATNTDTKDNEELLKSELLKSELKGLKDAVVESANKISNAAVAAGGANQPISGDELASRSLLLEETIRAHGQYSAILMGCLATLVVIVGVLLWRRMKEMEKKHIL